MLQDTFKFEKMSPVEHLKKAMNFEQRQKTAIALENINAEAAGTSHFA